MTKALKKILPRNVVQAVFILISLYLGWRFLNFYIYLESGGTAGSAYRPAGVEAFTPLSSLVGLRAWIGTGIFDYIHPAGLVIFLTALVISLLFRKSFCSWICPFGFIEEVLGRIGSRVLPWKLAVPRWLDLPLRGIKYLLLAFFAGSVFFMMDTKSAVSFMESPYNKLVDLKMLKFFLNISSTGLVVFGFLILMSFLFKHFWCRYLCPYGALLGLIGWLSPSRITRREHLCIDCGKCDKACPGKLKVSQHKKVLSPECTGCLDCVNSCPVDGALTYTLAGRLGDIKYLLPAVMLGLFALITISAMVTGYWESSVTVREVMYYFPLLEYI